MEARTPHPKRLSEQAAKDLQSGTIELPDTEALREASPHDPDKHVENVELVRTKAERFAILAHMALEICKHTLHGSGDETRFVFRPTTPDLNDRFKYAPLNLLENDLFDDKFFEETALTVLHAPEYSAIVARFKEIAVQIAADPGSEKEKFYSAENTITDRLGGLSFDAITSTLTLIRLIANHIRHEHPDFDAQKVRAIMLSNIDFMEELGNLNLAHSNNVMRGEYEGKTFNTSFEQSEDFADTVLKQEGDQYKLILLNRNPKPKTGLYGATLGCPANYHFEEGDTVIRQTATAIINEAYDRGIFNNIRTLKIPQFEN